MTGGLKSEKKIFLRAQWK